VRVNAVARVMSTALAKDWPETGSAPRRAHTPQTCLQARRHAETIFFLCGVRDDHRQTVIVDGGLTL